MNKKLSVCAVFFIVSFLPIILPSEDLTKTNPHILLITVDTLRVDRLGIYSKKHVKTPVIDRLAEKSFVFQKAYAHNPVTLPSHVNIMTGTTPLYHGISDNPGFILDDQFLTIAEFLKGKGYRTGAFVAAYPLDSRFGLGQGFDVYDDNYGAQDINSINFVERSATKVITPAIEWILSQKKKWFCWIHLFEPHEPYNPPAPFNINYSHDLYSGEVAYMDSQLAALMDFLKKGNLIENTIIIFTSDHGEALGEKGETSHSYFAYNNTIHIPLFIFIPGSHGEKINKNVCHVDIFPTICQLVKGKIPSHIQGQSLLPLMKQEQIKSRRIYFESMTPYLTRGWSPLRGYIEDNLKFIDLPIKELYDLQNDPAEEQNLISQQQSAKYLYNLIQLKKKLSGNSLNKRFKQIDDNVRRKLRSLGYLSSDTQQSSRFYTAKDDLKTLKPLQNKMVSAVNQFQRGKYEEAIKGLRELIRQRPDFIIAYDYLGGFLRLKGDTKGAISVLKEGLSSKPNNLNLLFKLGVLLTDDNKLNESIKILETCLLRNNRNPDYLNYLGVAYHKKGDFAQARKYYKKALEIDNSFATVHNNIGSLYLMNVLHSHNERMIKKAIKSFTAAIENDPRLLGPYNGRATAYKYQKEFQKAIEDWKKFIDFKPDHPTAYLNIAEVYLQMGKKKDALYYLHTCKTKFAKTLQTRQKKKLSQLLKQANP